MTKNVLSSAWEKFREHARRANKGQSRFVRHDPLVPLSHAVEKVLDDTQESTVKKDEK